MKENLAINKWPVITTISGLWLALSCSALAGQSDSLQSAIQEAALTNPGIWASWNAFEAADKGYDAAKGGYLPKLDMILEKGKERTEDPSGISDSYDTANYRLTLTQMLFDGFATKYDVAEQNYVKLARFYEFKASAEDVALETAGAYIDVLRYRELAELAKENYFHHVRYQRDIEGRVTSGISRGVDLEQARARLALSESNVLTETTNLHDVSVRFHRLVGQYPPAQMKKPVIPSKILPVSRQAALERGIASNPQLNAAIENIRSTRADLRGRKAPFMPRLDLRLRKQIDENTRGVEGEFDEEVIELVATYNFYNGGSDRARKRQSMHLMYEARDTRDRICREVRQTISIAYNDIFSKRKTIEYLERNERAISKARNAYKSQFDIGQRTLLDLLDTENEYFEVKRTLVNARHDFILAEVRTMASMGLLLYSLEISDLAKPIEENLDLSRDPDLNAKCPAESPEMRSVNFDVNKILGEPRQIPISKREVMTLDVKFENSSEQLTSGVKPEITRVAKFLCDNPLIKGVIEGHTDSLGSDSYNLRLSQARADSVLKALVRECPQASGRITSAGFGEIRPVARNDSALGRATNRRVELVLDNTSIE